jgi:hypothetical protein
LRGGDKAVSYASRSGGRRTGQLVLILAAVLLCGWALLALVREGNRSLALGPCSSGLDIDIIGSLFGWESAEPADGEVERLLEDPNFEASRKAEGDLRAGILDARLVSTLQTVAGEHQICVHAFKEGHYLLPGVPESTVIPEDYGEVGVLFSEYTRSGSEVPRSAERGGSHDRTVTDVEARVLGYASSLVRLVQPGQMLEGFM